MYTVRAGWHLARRHRPPPPPPPTRTHRHTRRWNCISAHCPLPTTLPKLIYSPPLGRPPSPQPSTSGFGILLHPKHFCILCKGSLSFFFFLLILLSRLGRTTKRLPWLIPLHSFPSLSLVVPSPPTRSPSIDSLLPLTTTTRPQLRRNQLIAIPEFTSRPGRSQRGRKKSTAKKG